MSVLSRQDHNLIISPRFLLKETQEDLPKIVKRYLVTCATTRPSTIWRGSSLNKEGVTSSDDLPQQATQRCALVLHIRKDALLVFPRTAWLPELLPTIVSRSYSSSNSHLETRMWLISPSLSCHDKFGDPKIILSVFLPQPSRTNVLERVAQPQ